MLKIILHLKSFQYLLELEQDLMTEETQMPVFFTKETQEILDIYADVRSSVNNDQAGSAAEGSVTFLIYLVSQQIVPCTMAIVKCNKQLRNNLSHLSLSHFCMIVLTTMSQQSFGPHFKHWC